VRNTDHILTTHSGSLPRPPELIEMNTKRARGEPVDQSSFQSLLKRSVSEVVERQRSIGIDVPDDGEFGKPTTNVVDYGAWWTYSYQRLSGLGIFVAAFIDPDDTIHVLGSGAITVIDASRLGYSSMGSARVGDCVCMTGIGLHILTQGARFDLHERAATPPPTAIDQDG
jgi:methionine synthase II (cobalamin-independent)